MDAAGGDLLSWLVKTTTPWGGIASTGLTGGIDLKLTVIPFILRGVSLIGIDSVTCPMDIRQKVWQRLGDGHEAWPLGGGSGDCPRGTAARVHDARRQGALAVRFSTTSRPPECDRWSGSWVSMTMLETSIVGSLPEAAVAGGAKHAARAVAAVGPGTARRAG